MFSVPYRLKSRKPTMMRNPAWAFIVVVACAFSVVPMLAQTVANPAGGSLLNHPNKEQEFPNFAQSLIEQLLSRHPEVLVVAIHAQIPGEEINRVIAINQAQWGKFLWRPSDDIDTDTAKTQRTIIQVIPATHRMEVHMPLHTGPGLTIATLVCVWSFKDEEEAPELMKRSQQMRDEIAPGVPSLGKLLGKP
jgi:hypothetical protein